MVSVKEFATMTGVGQNRVRELCYLSPASQEGKRFLIHLEAANTWLRKPYSTMMQTGSGWVVIRQFLLWTRQYP